MLALMVTRTIKFQRIDNGIHTGLVDAIMNLLSLSPGRNKFGLSKDGKLL
jgi:hypothetical protein